MLDFNSLDFDSAALATEQSEESTSFGPSEIYQGLAHMTIEDVTVEVKPWGTIVKDSEGKAEKNEDGTFKFAEDAKSQWLKAFITFKLGLHPLFAQGSMAGLDKDSPRPKLSIRREFGIESAGDITLVTKEGEEPYTRVKFLDGYNNSHYLRLIPTKKADFNKLVTEGKIQDAIKTCCEVPDAGYRIDLNTAYIARKGQHEDLIKFINANLFLKNKAWMEKDKYEALVKSYTSASNEAKKSFSPEQQLIVFGKAGAIAEGKKGPIITFPNYVLSVAPGRKYGIFEGKPLALSLGSSFGKAKITDLKLTIQEGKTHGCWQLLGYKKSDDGTKVYQKVFNKYCETSRAMFGNYAGSDKTEYEKMGKYLNDRLTKAMQEGDNFNKFDANYEMEFSFVGMSKVEDQAVSNSFANIASDLNQMENSTQMEGLGGL